MSELYKITCPHCGGKISFEKEALGQTSACPHCQQPIQLTVPGAGPEVAASSTASLKVEPSTASQQAAPPSTLTKSSVAAPSKSRVLKWMSIGVAAVILLGGAGTGIYLYRGKQKGPLKHGTIRDAAANWEESADNFMTVHPYSGENKDVSIAKTGTYEVLFRRDFQIATMGYCEVTYLGSKPSPAEVDQLVKESVAKCAKLDPALQIIGMAFQSNSALAKADYSGPVVWDPEAKQIGPLRR